MAVCTVRGAAQRWAGTKALALAANATRAKVRLIICLKRLMRIASSIVGELSSLRNRAQAFSPSNPSEKSVKEGLHEHSATKREPHFCVLSSAPPVCLARRARTNGAEKRARGRRA